MNGFHDILFNFFNTKINGLGFFVLFFVWLFLGGFLRQGKGGVRIHILQRYHESELHYSYSVFILFLGL